VQVPVNAEGKMGVVIAESPNITEVKEVSYSFPEALVQAGYETGRLSVLTMQLFVKVIFDLFTKAEISEQVSGPVGIAQLTHQTTQNGTFSDILKLIALLSISLGAINVLPIPALDGGRFLSIIFEVVTRKRPNATWEARIHAFGFILLIILILAVTFNDILRLLE
jgi:regulator of sigma E protease